MLKFAAGLIVGLLLLGFVTYISRGQSAAVNVKSKEIRQGDNVTMEVTVDKAPNLDGKIYVAAAPIDSKDEIGLTCNLNSGSTTCQVGGPVPLDAKLGKWAVTRVVFQTLAPEKPKTLLQHGEASFQVVARTDVVQPDSATVTDIK